jgi:ribosomal protein S18 acetylase RimI-like enzyme
MRIKNHRDDNRRSFLELVIATRGHLTQMHIWFKNAASCVEWGGPEFRFPFTNETFFIDTKMAEVPSYALIRDCDELCGFGQFYLRAGRCHLSRLAIAPLLRGQSLGTELVGRLMRLGTERLGVSQCSLFVYTNNTVARSVYEHLGFIVSQYPDSDFSHPGIYYMIAE